MPLLARFGEQSRGESPESEKREKEKLEIFLEEISEKLKAEGIPVEDDCRIDMGAFGEVYSKEVIQRDRGWVRKCEKEWYGDISEEEIKEEKLKRTGEKLEMLKTAIFSKFLEEEFFVVRTSAYDDIKNKSDNVMVEKETGNVICAFDEVGETSGARYEAKKAEVLARNRRETGGRLKYGLRWEKDEEGQEKIVLAEVESAPIFYLALPQRHIEEGIRELVPSFDESSEYERNLFSYFLTTITAQAEFLCLEPRLRPTLKKRLDSFKTTLAKLRSKDEKI